MVRSGIDRRRGVFILTDTHIPQTSSMTRTVLLVEDDRDIAALVKLHLQDIHCRAEIAGCGQEALTRYAHGCYDLVILDLMLPGLDGLSVCRILRRELDVPIIILTAAHVTSEDTVRGLELGANDYVIKPFNQQVMVARIRSALRWSVKAPNGILYEDDILSINVHKREVVKNGELLKLTKKEFALLVALVTESPAIVNHEELFAKVWDETYAFDVNYVRIFVGHLRKKLESDPANPEYIHNERGVGYRFEHISEPDAASA